MASKPIPKGLKTKSPGASPERSPEENALAASELRYRRLFETAQDGILILDAETGVVVDVNPFLTDLLGYPYEDFVGKAVWELGFFKDIVANQDNFAELQQKEYIRYEDKPLKTADGRRVDVEFVSNVYLVENKKVIQCNIRNITERKRAEEARARLAMAVEQAAETVMITDKDGTILYTNPVFEKTSGYTCQEVIGKNPRILKSGKQDAGFYRQMWATLSREEVWRGHLTNKRKNGTLYEEEASISPVRDAADRVVNYVAVKRDVTRELELENRLRQTHKMEALGRLAGGVAHDFNNILGIILGYTTMSLKQASPGQPLYVNLQEIRKAAERSADLTRQLLTFASKQTIVPKVLNLNDALTDMLKMLRRLIGEDINLVSLPGADLRPVRIDPVQVDQILANLCLNARDAIAGAGTITLETGNATLDADCCAEHADAVPGEYVFLSVSDDGSGMDPETMAHIFEPFYTTKHIGKGTGLGLAIVYGIVQQNNGFISVCSEPGKGTTFRVYLPQVAAEAVHAVVTGTAKTPEAKGETILLVEDEPSLRELCKIFLDGLGYTVLSAEAPEEALELFNRHAGDIHLLLTDVVMPGMNGQQLAKRICEIKPDIQVLFMSGYSADVIADCVLDKDTAFIAKPFSLDKIARKIRDLLDVHKSA